MRVLLISLTLVIAFLSTFITQNGYGPWLGITLWPVTLAAFATAVQWAVAGKVFLSVWSGKTLAFVIASIVLAAFMVLTYEDLVGPGLAIIIAWVVVYLQVMLLPRKRIKF